MKRAFKWSGIVILVLCLGAVYAFASGEKPAEEQFITIHWAQWAPSDYLEKLSEGFTAETGIKVVVEQTPWETFVQKYNTEMIARSDAWDIIVGDSQDIGNMAANGHYLELTDWIKEKGVDKMFTPASLTYYAEYPKGGGRYYAVPCEGDALGWAYRKDLFDDSKNKADFRAKYGYALGVPKSWDMLKDIAEFFQKRPGQTDDPSKEFYGISIYGDNGYDSLAMFAEQAIWVFGGELGDYSTYKVDGLLNSEGSIQGIEYYHELFKFTPPGFGDAFYVKANDAFTAGIVPMTCNYFAFFPALANEATNPFAEDTGYFPCPPQKGYDGKVRQFASLGGQGASVVTYSKKQDLAFQWLDWFIKKDTQMEWARLGGYTCHAEVLESDEFLNAAPYNPAFKTSMEIFKDWWACPEYDELLRTFSQTIADYVIGGKGTAEQALNKCTDQWTEIFERAGYYD
jgi:multiple sugar transport system substrate-binding protein